jgi:hypothetical protein
MIDGVAGDVCDYVFDPVTGVDAMNVSPASATICAGGNVNLTASGGNGIYTWSPGSGLSATTGANVTATPAGSILYTVTSTGTGACPVALTKQVSITVTTPPAAPVISPVTYCQGAIASALTAGGSNLLWYNAASGGTGSSTAPVPSTASTGTVTYYVSQSIGLCESPRSAIAVTVNPTVTPTFNPVAAICFGTALAALPTISLNGINGTWLPALNNTATTVYTFTPTAGQCANTTTLTTTVNPILSPTVNCGVSTTSSVNFTWALVAGATGYNVSYQVNASPVINIGAIGNLLTYSVTGLSGGDNVTITVTPTGGAGTCFAAAVKTCTATACTPPTASINYATPFCVTAGAQTVTLTGTGSFTGGTYSAPAGLSINSATGTITPGSSTPSTYTVTYTIAASGGCAAVTATTPITIKPKPSAIIIYHN